MESHQPDEENKTETRTTPDDTPSQPTATQPPPPPPLPPGRGGAGEQAGNVPAMGYPPPMYPAAPSGYYQPPPQGYIPYPYAQAPPAPYYPSAMPPPQTAAKGSPFARAILLAIVVLVMLMCASSIITWIVLRPELPFVELNTLSVSNFTTNPRVFDANWVANLTFHNTNTKLMVYFEWIQTLMYYNIGSDEFVISTSYIAPFYMNIKTARTMATNMTARNGPVNMTLPGDILMVEKMDKDRRQGEVIVDYRMRVLTVLKSGSWWSRRAVLTVQCDDLKIKFMGQTGIGNAILSPHDRDCYVFS